jgi:hypothetical protein
MAFMASKFSLIIFDVSLLVLSTHHQAQCLTRGTNERMSELNE